MPTEVTCVDLENPEVNMIRVIEDDWLIICDGTYYLDGVVEYANGTTVITVKTGLDRG